MSSDHTMPNVDVAADGCRTDTDADSNTSTQASTSMMVGTDSDASPVPSSGSGKLSVCSYNVGVRVAKEKQADANRKLREIKDKEQLVADYEHTIDIQRAASKHKQNIESMWKSRCTMAETMIGHQDAFWDTMDTTDDYFKTKKSAQQADRDVRGAENVLRTNVAANRVSFEQGGGIGRLPHELRAESDSSNSSDRIS